MNAVMFLGHLGAALSSLGSLVRTEMEKIRYVIHYKSHLRKI